MPRSRPWSASRSSWGSSLPAGPAALSVGGASCRGVPLVQVRRQLRGGSSVRRDRPGRAYPLRLRLRHAALSVGRILRECSFCRAYLADDTPLAQAYRRLRARPEFAGCALPEGAFCRAVRSSLDASCPCFRPSHVPVLLASAPMSASRVLFGRERLARGRSRKPCEPRKTVLHRGRVQLTPISPPGRRIRR